MKEIGLRTALAYLLGGMLIASTAWYVGGELVADKDLVIPQSILDMNNAVHTAIAYQVRADGTPPVTGSEEAVLRARSGHCGNYAYVLANRLAQAGYDAKIISLYGVDGLLNHAVVQVDGEYVLDPTTGAAYPHTVLDMWQDPMLAEGYSGAVDPKYAMYVGSQLYEAVTKVAALSKRGSGHGVELQTLAELTVREGRFYSSTEAMLSDGSTSNTAGAAPGSVNLMYRWETPVRISYVSIVPHMESKTFPSRIRLEASLQGEPVISREVMPVLADGTMGIRIPDYRQVDTLNVLFEEFIGPQDRLVIREIVIVGHAAEQSESH
jgi:hypothetical protein